MPTTGLFQQSIFINECCTVCIACYIICYIPHPECSASTLKWWQPHAVSLYSMCTFNIFFAPFLCSLFAPCLRLYFSSCAVLHSSLHQHLNCVCAVCLLKTCLNSRPNSSRGREEINLLKLLTQSTPLLLFSCCKLPIKNWRMVIICFHRFLPQLLISVTTVNITTIWAAGMLGWIPEDTEVTFLILTWPQVSSSSNFESFFCFFSKLTRSHWWF